MTERKLGDYCPTPTQPAVTYSAELHINGAVTSCAGVTHEGVRFGGAEDFALLQRMAVPFKYFTFDETGFHATMHLEWRGLTVSRHRTIARMRLDLAQFAPELVPVFEEAYDCVKHAFRPNAEPVESP